ncbi:MAG: hypothetical protein NZ874_09560 [Fimbriimonadales bacterium]|nr:hypothetical protein [Fimbriimonadales bacterium]
MPQTISPVKHSPIGVSSGAVVGGDADATWSARGICVLLTNWVV